MGCCGHREKGIRVSEQQKWDFITLSDFKSTSCLTPVSYVWLWILVLVSGAVYAADAFTAVNLLAFNKWSSQVKPKVSFDVAKWIFAICIIVSYVFLAYRWFRAIRVMRSGAIVECYLEPLAAIFQSMRVTKQGQGWRRFLVFAELTKSSKGVDYLALFVYFQFKSALIVVLAQGPRIAINALTLWAVMQASLIPVGEHAAPKDRSPAAQFFKNMQTLINTGNKQETVIYFTMLFSLVIWVIAALSLLISLPFYLFFLWQYVPEADGSLTKYCRRKIESRLERVVGKKIQKALEKQDQKRRKEELQKGHGETRCPTLPKLGGPVDNASRLGLSRSDTLSTVTTLPPYSRAGAASTLPPYAYNAPLLSQAGEMGMSEPLPPMSSRGPTTHHYPASPSLGRPPSRTPGRLYSPMAPGRATSGPPRSVSPPVNTSFAGHTSPCLVSPLPPALRAGTPLQGSPLYPSSRPSVSPLDANFVPFDKRAPMTGPAYVMSPVDMADGSAPPGYTGPAMSPRYTPAQLPLALRAGLAAPKQSSPMPPRAITAPPSHAQAGVPVPLPLSVTKRKASLPTPRGMHGYSSQQRSAATAPQRDAQWDAEARAGSTMGAPRPQGHQRW